MQLVVLCEFLLREFLSNSSEEISAVFEAYGETSVTCMIISFTR